MSIVLTALGEFVLYAVLATFAQNAVFGRSLGVTRLVLLVDDGSTDSLGFCALLTLVQLLSTPLCWGLNHLTMGMAYRAPLRPLGYVLITAAVTALVWLIARSLRNATRLGPTPERMAELLPLAAFNSCVLGTQMVVTVQALTFAEAMGFALGSGAGYYLAVLLVTEGQRRLRSRRIPASFRGLPITLVYIGILALAIYGFTGHTLLV